jgi:hypothetical protein
MKKSAALNLFLILVTSYALTGCTLPSGNTQTNPAAAPIPTNTPLPPTPLPGPKPTEIPVEPTITPEPAIVHVLWPGSPLGTINQTVHDQIDTTTASQKQAFGGDDYKNGKYERPFDKDMNYLPYADLETVQLNRADPLWVYISFKVTSELTEDAAKDVHFLVEIDKDLDNRGDILITTGRPKGTDWSTESVKVLSNPDLNIGGTVVVRPDPALSESRGYYEVLFDNGKGSDPDLAMSKLSKNDPNTVLLAFKNSLTGGEKGKFIWLPWTDIGMLDWSMFEFNDHFTYEQAGYPLKEDAQNYPIKAIWGVDNTCREPSGFTPNGTMPGLCPNYDPPPSHGPSKESSCVKVCTSFGATKLCVCQ